MVDNVYIPASATYDETYVAHRIIDIAPTLTELAGVRRPWNAEGNVITQIFAEGNMPPEASSDSPLIPVIGAAVVAAVIIGVILLKRPF